MQIDRTTLRRLWPRAPLPLIDAVAAHSALDFAKYGLTTRLRAVHFLAQVSHESGGGTIGRENLSYTSAERIAAVWPRRFTPESARPYVHNPQKLADKVYNGRMGNRPGSDDGYLYRGGSLLQLTGRDSYRDIGALVGLQLESHPDLVASPTYALEIAAAEFKKLGCLPFCDKDNIEAVTRRVNGGYIGLASRKAWLEKWKATLAAATSETADPPAETPVVPSDEPPPVDVPRGSDDSLPPGVDHPKGKTMMSDSSTWATILGTLTAIGTTLGSAVDALRPLLIDYRTIGAVLAVVGIAGVVILYKNRAQLRDSHVF
jgi:putative chitinase